MVRVYYVRLINLLFIVSGICYFKVYQILLRYIIYLGFIMCF
jgi:hypothetical protein